MKRILWWLRRDLRINDNVVLHHALHDGAAVIPVFILDPKLLDSNKLAPARKQFLIQSLAVLDKNLKKRGSYLVVRTGDPARELLKLVRETQADAVYFHADYTPYAIQRDANVVAALDRAGVKYESFNDLYLADPNQVVKDDGSAYTVYSPYRTRFERVVTIPERYSIKRKFDTPPDLASLDLNALLPKSNAAFAQGGETIAHQLAQDFVTRKNGLAQYSESRNDMGADATSHLSPHLHFGTVSVRELVRMARKEISDVPRQRKRTGGAGRTPGENAKVWIDELVWREFFSQVLYHFPHAARQSFRPEYADLPWETDADLFAAWSQGQTGFPIVDAGMRQLNATGWMHNRSRMIVASFLTKDLLVNWQDGESYFLQHLIDGDMASNNGGWQWAAGTGTDAQPYFRIFNPILQGARFDPAGEYIRRWVPELASVPDPYIHTPWELPADMARRIGFTLGQTYPKPMVNHAVQRERALALYRHKTARNGARPVESTHYK